MNSFEYKEFTIHHKVKKSLKNSYISIDANMQIILKTPKVNTAYLEELLYSKENWLRKAFVRLEKNKAYEINLEDEVALFGEIYSIDSDESAYLRESLSKLKDNSKQKVIKCYDIFYKNIASSYITSRVEYYSKIMNLEYQTIKYRKMKSRWGSCTSKKVLTFNTELMKVRKELIDYVVVHELAHLKHMNHSKEFHSFVDSFLENSLVYRKRLKNTRITTF